MGYISDPMFLNTHPQQNDHGTLFNNIILYQSVVVLLVDIDAHILDYTADGPLSVIDTHYLSK